MKFNRILVFFGFIHNYFCLPFLQISSLPCIQNQQAHCILFSQMLSVQSNPTFISNKQKFVSPSCAYTWKDIETCATLCNLSYCKNITVNQLKDIKWNCDAFSDCTNLTSTFIYNSTTQANVYIFSSPGYLILSFSGTKHLQEWKYNMNSKKIEFPFVDETFYVHEGFFDYYVSLRQSILNIVNNRDKSCRVLCLGHSLGSPLGSYAALDIDYLGFNVDCITFGSPRLGDYKFTEVFKKRIINRARIVNDKDIVPNFPSYIRGYFHTSPIIKIIDKNNIVSYEEERNILTKFNIISIYISFILQILKNNSIREHYMNSYLQQIQQITNNTN
jgi:hypothetical protein